MKAELLFSGLPSAVKYIRKYILLSKDGSAVQEPDGKIEEKGEGYPCKVGGQKPYRTPGERGEQVHGKYNKKPQERDDPESSNN